jgi:CheY-like chemotaxis protein
MRCGRCDAIFRVRAPAEVPAPAATPAPPVPQAIASPAEQPGTRVPHPPGTPQEPQHETVDRERLVLVALPDVELAKQTASVLRRRGLHASVVHDGVEAMLEIQRELPRVAVLSATLPKMYGFQICEVMKRNESLRSTPVVLVGSIHHADRYRSEPSELYGADAYLEDPDLPGGLIPILERIGLPIAPAPAPSSESNSVASPRPAPAPAAPQVPPPRPAQQAPVVPAQAAPRSATTPAPAAALGPEPAPARADDGLAEERAKAERLARIIVSDIILYNEEKFAEALRRGSVVEMMNPDLGEGRGMFRDRIDERVREEKDYLTEELLRVARLRGTT